MSQIWEWTKRITTVLFFAILIVFGGRMGWNYYKYGNARGEKYESKEHNREKNINWKKSREALILGLEILKKPEIDLWKANEVYQELDKLPCFSNPEENIPKNITELTNKILDRLGEIFKDFVSEVIKGKINLSELEEGKFVVVATVKLQAEKLFKKRKGSLKSEERQQGEMMFTLLGNKIQEEKSRRIKL